MVQFMENLFGIQAHPEVNVQNFKNVIIPGMLARDKIDEKGTTILRKKLCHWIQQKLWLPKGS